MNKKLVLVLSSIILMGLALIIVKAQVGNRINANCLSDGVINVTARYESNLDLNTTYYFAVMKTGRCTSAYSNYIRGTHDINRQMVAEVQNEINNRNINFVNNRNNTIIRGTINFTLQ